MKTYIASLDFDGVLRYNDMEKECIDLFNAIPDNVIKTINTGRGISILFEKIKQFFPNRHQEFIEAINYYICNNGSDLYFKDGNSYKVLNEWSNHLADQWNREEILNRLTPLAEKLEFEIYPENYNFKLLYYFLRHDFNEVDLAMAEFKAAIADLPLTVSYAESSQKAPEGWRKFLCEIFPQKAGKGSALVFLKNYLKLKGTPVDSIACFGDDRNDLQTVADMPLKYDWWYGCLVGNSTEWILEKTMEAKKLAPERIIIAPKEYEGPNGVLWLMNTLGWLSEKPIQV